MGLSKALVRLLAVIGKEIVEVFRRPGAVLSLILGPFLILAAFGFGYQGIKSDLATIVVVDPASDLPTDVQSYRDLAIRGLALHRRHARSICGGGSAAQSGRRTW